MARVMEKQPTHRVHARAQDAEVFAAGAFVNGPIFRSGPARWQRAAIAHATELAHGQPALLGEVVFRVHGRFAGQNHLHLAAAVVDVPTRSGSVAHVGDLVCVAMRVAQQHCVVFVAGLQHDGAQGGQAAGSTVASVGA